ncbi:hypothetical protein AOR_1_394144 [Paecilomyces variotii No. 5]|uniref:ORC6 first cyclin-like domain-containing protein n=1 Tax=Byssochlamys spectabilis (strain No. 5 / NBRC 109023) TaxID=1356009 RepID=V5FDD1_BYSSN|nr:hypothetical protein AOR_1_394144 [Paecilomyces variotii No. 5]
MNNRPVEQALATLLPTHADDLPPELLSLALSLVAQSRSYSTSLKPEEEIARPYACAEIACKRLSRSLKLPPLLGHPPCPPRLYKKLYAFLDRSLASSTISTKRTQSGSVVRTPTRPSSVTTTPTKNGGTALRTATPRTLQGTPTKSTPLKRSTGPATPSSTSRHQLPVRRAGINGPTSTIVGDAPKWVMPAIRTVCKTLSTPAPRMSTWSRPPISRTLPPHIFSGVSSILHFVPSSESDSGDLDEDSLEFLEPIITTQDKENDEDYKELVSALIVAVYFLVLSRRRSPAPGESSGDGSSEGRKMDKKTFSEMRQTAPTCLGLPTNERRHREDVDAWIALIMEQDWAKGKEWFENVPYAGANWDEATQDELGLVEDDEEGPSGTLSSKRHKKDHRLDEASTRGGLLPGLGTMMQDRIDWLSDERMEDYLEWKRDILKRAETLERTGKAVA